MEHKRSHSFCLFYWITVISLLKVHPHSISYHLHSWNLCVFCHTNPQKQKLFYDYDMIYDYLECRKKKNRKGTSKMWKLLSHHSNSCSIQNPSNNQTLVDHKIKPAYFQYINTTQTKHYTFVVIILFSHSSFKIRHLFNRSALML